MTEDFTSLIFRLNSYLLLTKLKSMYDNVILLTANPETNQLNIIDRHSIETIKITIQNKSKNNTTISHRIDKKEFIKKLQARCDYNTQITFANKYPIIYLSDFNGNDFSVYISTHEGTTWRFQEIDDVLIHFEKYIK